MANASAAVGASRFHTAFRSKKNWRCGESRGKRISHPQGALHRLKKGVEGNGAGYPEMGSGHSGVARNRPTDKKKRSIRSANRKRKSRENNFSRLFLFAAAMNPLQRNSEGRPALVACSFSDSSFPINSLRFCCNDLLEYSLLRYSDRVIFPCCMRLLFASICLSTASI